MIGQQTSVSTVARQMVTNWPGLYDYAQTIDIDYGRLLGLHACLSCPHTAIYSRLSLSPSCSNLFDSIVGQFDYFTASEAIIIASC